MTPEIIEGNKLIFDFDDNAYWMDVEGGKIRIVHGGVFTDSTLKYHYSWDWLMPSWAKLRRDVWELGQGYPKDFMVFVENFKAACFNNSIGDARNAVIDGIKWYNTQTKQP